MVIDIVLPAMLGPAKNWLIQFSSQGHWGHTDSGKESERHSLFSFITMGLARLVLPGWKDDTELGSGSNH